MFFSASFAWGALMPEEFWVTQAVTQDNSELAERVQAAQKSGAQNDLAIRRNGDIEDRLQV